MALQAAFLFLIGDADETTRTVVSTPSIHLNVVGCKTYAEAEAAAKELAAGQPVSLELADRFAQAVKEDINPRDSWRAAKDFRMHIAVESARRAFIEAVKLAGGDL